MELRLEHLVKDFSGTKAVNDVSITIQDGKLTGLLGPSGCGKSTTLYLISGLESPTSGRIFFGNRDVTALPPEKRGIGLVFQNYALYPHLTVEQNIAFPLVNHKEGKEEIRRRTLEMARLVQIEDLLKRKPGQLSGGQQQRVAIARALVKRPDILLLDEPLSNLDARLRLEMREEIRRIQTETGVTTVFVTHDQEEAMSITDEIVLMRTGVVQQQCPPQQMYLNPANRFVAGFLGNPPSISFGWTCAAERCVWQRTTCSGCTARRMGRSWWASGLRRGVWGRGFGLRLRLWRCGARICWLPSHWQGSGPAPFWTSPPVWRQATPWS